MEPQHDPRGSPPACPDRSHRRREWLASAGWGVRGVSDKAPSLNALRAHAQMMAIFAALGIPVSTAIVIDKDGVRVSLPVKEDEGE